MTRIPPILRDIVIAAAIVGSTLYLLSQPMPPAMDAAAVPGTPSAPFRLEPLSESLWTAATNPSVTLQWDPSETPGVSYRAYVGTNSGDYHRQHDGPGTNTTWTAWYLNTNQIWYFTVTARKDGLESDFSNEVAYQPSLGSVWWSNRFDVLIDEIEVEQDGFKLRVPLPFAVTNSFATDGTRLSLRYKAKVWLTPLPQFSPLP